VTYCGYFTILCYAIVSSLYYSLYIEDFLALGPAVKAGIESGMGWTKECYMIRLSQLKILTKIMYMFERKEPIKQTYTRLTNMLQTMHVDTADGSLRKQPFCVYLYGPAGSGKTTYAIKLAIKLLKAKYGETKKSDIVILNETDSFQSEYRSYHKVVIFDDFAQQMSTAPEATNHYRKLIDFVNNVRKTCLNPNVEMKGIVQIQPEVVIITSNVEPSYGYSSYVRSLDAILRRFNYVIYINNERKTVPLRFDFEKEINPGTGKQVRNSGYPLITNRYTKQQCTGARDSEGLQHSFDNLDEEVLLMFLKHDEEQGNFTERVNREFDDHPKQKEIKNEKEIKIKKDFRYYCTAFVGRYCIPESPTYKFDWRIVVRPFMLDLFMKLKTEKVETQVRRVVENCSQSYAEICWDIVSGKIVCNYIKNPMTKYRLEYDDVLPDDNGFTAKLLYDSYIQSDDVFELITKVYHTREIPETMVEAIKTLPLGCQMDLYSMIQQVRELPSVKHRRDDGYLNESHMLSALKDSAPFGLTCIAQQRVLPDTEFDGVFICVHGGVLAVIVVELKTKLTDGAKNKGRKQLIKQINYLRSILTFPNVPFYGALYGDKLSFYAVQEKSYPTTEEVILGWLKRSIAYVPCCPDLNPEASLSLLYSCTLTNNEDCSTRTQNSDGSQI